LKILKDISTIGIGDIIGTSITTIFWFYLASIISPSEFGEIHYIISIASIISYFTLLGTGNTLTVYIAQNKQIATVLLNFSIIFGIIILIASLILDFFHIGLLILGIIIFIYGISRDVARKEFKKYSFNIVLQKGLTAVLAYLGFHFFGIEGVIYGLAISYFVYSRYVIQDIAKNKIGYNQIIINLKEIKNNKKFIFTNYSSMVIQQFTTQADKILIVPILGITILGNYSLAGQIIAILIMLPNIIFKFILPNYIDGKISPKLKRNTILLSFVLVFLGVFVSPMFIEEFFEQYTEVIDMIQIMSFAVIPITINQFYFAKFLSKEDGKTPLFGGIISSSIMMSGMIILGTLFEEIGIAITYLISYSGLCLFYFLKTKNERV